MKIKTITAYALVTKSGNLILRDERLPIYWLKGVAEYEAERQSHKTEVVKVKIDL